uniref:Uncharacterized protein n=1 Tax=Anguilla anguilla TaxID=7936 RepID=A0A0E9V017_ANGAN
MIPRSAPAPTTPHYIAAQHSKFKRGTAFCLNIQNGCNFTPFAFGCEECI